MPPQSLLSAWESLMVFIQFWGRERERGISFTTEHCSVRHAKPDKQREREWALSFLFIFLKHSLALPAFFVTVIPECPCPLYCLLLFYFFPTLGNQSSSSARERELLPSLLPIIMMGSTEALEGNDHWSWKRNLSIHRYKSSRILSPLDTLFWKININEQRETERDIFFFFFSKTGIFIIKK